MDEATRADLVDAIEMQGSDEDIQRLGRLVRARDSEADRAHLRMLVVYVADRVCPGPPDVLEGYGKAVVAGLRGKALRCGCERRQRQ